jgi:alpha-methylacyl-CoA racemase
MAVDPPRAERTGALAGLKVIEMAGLGPVPLAALMLAEMGAEVLRIERAGEERPFLDMPDEYELARHGRSILKIDIKQDDGRDLLLKLATKADVLLEGFRPGVMERLSLGPDAMLSLNPALVYGRMTGFGQDGPLAGRAGMTSTTWRSPACSPPSVARAKGRFRRSTWWPTMAAAR